MTMYKVLVPLWLDDTGRGYAQGAEEDFEGVDEGLVAHMITASQIMLLSEWQAPDMPGSEPVEEIETHPHHVGDGPPAPDTWEAVWGTKSGKSNKKAEG